MPVKSKPYKRQFNPIAHEGILINTLFDDASHKKVPNPLTICLVSGINKKWLI